MFKNKFLANAVLALFALVFAVSETQAQQANVFMSGLKAPQKIIYAPQQNYFLVSEAGIANVPNSGRISIVTNEGVRTTLIDGLPSGPAPPENGPSGPSALAIRGDSLYIAIGAGNSTLNGPAPGTEIPNPNPNSPLFSSVLELKFISLDVPFDFGNTNVLTGADHTRLANGETVYILGQGVFGNIRLVADFPNFTPAPRPGVPNNVRPSNPYGLALGDRKRANSLYVADAAQNNILKVDLSNRSVETLITYLPRQNPNQGPPVIDAVPDSLRLFNNKLLVTFLTGFPFPAGSADVRQYNLDTGAESQIIGGLTAAIDVLPVNGDGFCTTFYTLEFSTNMLAGAPGRLMRYESVGATPTVISNTLISPTSIARHPASGDILVTETFPGRITRISNLPASDVK